MKPTPLNIYRQETIYHAAMDIYPAVGGEESADVERCFHKAILYVMRWLRERWEKNRATHGVGEDSKAAEGNEIEDSKAAEGTEDSRAAEDDVIAALWERLQQYPDPAQCAEFDLKQVKALDGDCPSDLQSIYSEQEACWALMVREPGDESKENSRGRSFQTDISVQMKNDHVFLAVRELCSTKTSEAFYTQGYRPAFVMQIIRDRDFDVVESGLAPKYAYAGKAYRLNGKSATECEAFKKELLNNPARKLPVLLLSEQAEEKLGEISVYGEPKKRVDSVAYSCCTYCHVVVVEKGVRKLLQAEHPDFAEHLEKGGSVFCAENSRLFSGEEYEELFAWNEEKGWFTGTFKDLTDRELRKHHAEISDKGFYQKLYFDLQMRELVGDDDSKEKLKEVIRRLKEELFEEEKRRSEAEHLLNTSWAECQELQKNQEEKIKKLEAENSKLKSHHDHMDMRVEDYKAQAAHAQKQAESAGQQKQAGPARGGNYMELLNRHRVKTLLAQMPSPGDKDELIKWIEERYADTLIVHEKAKKSLRKCEWPNNSDSYKTLLLMIHYLHGCTLRWNASGEEKNPNAGEAILEEFRYLISGVADEGVGDSTISHYQDQYTIDIAEYYRQAVERGDLEAKNRSGKVTLEKHLKRGVGSANGENMIRIYYHYDAELKKTIIGYMPGHMYTIAQGNG
ncbi:MAG: hypothetical protein IJ794_15975 [Lachnospiraceae bacterium]|nr:hypothetical protein [Lachnospiraceae bacterium]